MKKDQNSSGKHCSDLLCYLRLYFPGVMPLYFFT